MKRVKLNDLLAAISSAITTTQHMAREQHHANLHEHFEDSGDDHVRPKTTKMLLPKDHVGPGEDQEGVAHVPHMALTNHDQIHLSELDLELECVVEEVEDCKDAPPLLSLLIGGGVPKKSKAGTLRLSFKTVDTPEGVSQVNDSMLKSF